MTIYPWQQTVWQHLTKLHQTNRLPHALLFSGIAGIGKKHCAELFAATLLNVTPNAKKFDLLLIEPEETGQMIKIDVIRELIQSVSETSLFGGYRVIILNPAHAMNINAANALLKTLEEPAPQTLFILISDQPGRLPATIRSRCQEIFFEKPERALALQWLENNTQVKNSNLLLNLANGAPLHALAISENNLLSIRDTLFNGIFAAKLNPLSLAEQLQEFDLLVIFQLLQTALQDLLRLILTHGQAELIHFDLQQTYFSFFKKISLDHLMRYIDFVKETYIKISGPFNLNKLLVLEETFIQWLGLTHDVN